MQSPSPALTDRQREVLRTIVAHIDQHGAPPSVVELSHALGLSHRMASYGYLNSLEFKGYIRRQYGVARSIVVLRKEDGAAIEGQDEAA